MDSIENLQVLSNSWNSRSLNIRESNWTLIDYGRNIIWSFSYEQKKKSMQQNFIIIKV